MISPSQPARASSAIPLVAAGAVLIAALAWLVSRLWLGISFADEMLYYGEIGGLVRTGRFFQDDLAVQQLAYLFVYPLFKLHAAVFPDQSYLVLYGRGCLLLAYLAVGMIFWRAAGRAGGFTLAHKLTGLGAFFAWIPFQIFAFSYNTLSYLLAVVLIAEWWTRDPARPRRYLLTTALLLTVLTYSYPPMGLLLIPLAVLEVLWRLGRRPALVLLGAIALFGGMVLVLIGILQGPRLLEDVHDTVKYSRGFNVARTIMFSDHLRSLALLLATAATFVLRCRLGRPFTYPLGPASAPALRWVGLAVLVTGGAALLGLAVNWKGGFVPACAFTGLMVVAAGSLGPAPSTPVALRFENPALFHYALLAAVVGGALALLAIGRDWMTGYFITIVIMLLLALLAAWGTRAECGVAVALAIAGSITGAIVAFTSSNGIHNFGVGAAGAAPFLFLLGARTLAASPAGRILPWGCALPALTCLLLWNGLRNPYTEQAFDRDFHRIEGVPAFRGIWTSPEKIEAIARFQALTAPVDLHDRRILVVGPHPWLYFVTRARPATSMFWMLFIGSPESYEMVAKRLFRDGPPDAILLTENTLPPAIAAKVTEWMQAPFVAERAVLPGDFNLRFGRQAGVLFTREVFLLSRPPAAHPAVPAANRAP